MKVTAMPAIKMLALKRKLKTARRAASTTALMIPAMHAEREAFRRIGDRDRGEGGHDHEAIEGDIENSGLISEETAERGVNQRRRDADGGVGDVGVHHRVP